MLARETEALMTEQEASSWIQTHAIESGEQVGEDGTVVDNSGSTEVEYLATEEEPSTEPLRAEAVWSHGVLSLLTSTSDDLVDVWVSLSREAWEPGDHVQVQVMRAVLEGRIETDEDAVQVVAGARDARAEQALAAWAERRPDLVSIGAEVQEVGPMSANARIRLPARSFAALLDDHTIVAAELVGESPDAANAGYWQTVTGPDITGYEAEDLLQTDLYYSEGYQGEGYIGQVEPGGSNIYSEHPGFQDDGSGGIRVHNCDWNSSGSTCSEPTPDPGDSHPTAVASVLVGDVTDGQDGSVSVLGHARAARSGVAREASVRGVETLAIGEDVFAESAYSVDILNMSAGNGDVDTTCLGTDSGSISANSIFESGIAVFVAAGNLGSDDPADCRVNRPASAIGAFAVGAYDLDSSDNEGLYDDPDTGYTPGDNPGSDNDDAGSSRGGTDDEGDGRTIIGLMAPTPWQFPYAYSSTLTDGSSNPLVYGTDWPTSAPGPENFCCTSAATPAVAGSANLFRQWYVDRYGSLTDPALLYTSMMLMGDRTVEGGSQTTGDPDGLWGMGKLRMRLFNGVGMDNPYGYGVGTLCVPDHTWAIHDLGTVSLPSGVDVVRVVSWWYDSRHDSGTPSDVIQMRVGYESGGSTTWIATRSGPDNRHRVQLNSPTTGLQYRMGFYGSDVTADAEGCGNNSMRIYYAWFYEDSARESGENLDHVRTE